MAQYVGIDVGRRDVGVVKIDHDGSTSSRYVAPDGPPYENVGEWPDGDYPLTFSEVFTVACSRTDGKQPTIPLETPTGDGYRESVRRVPDPGEFELDGVQRRLRADGSVSVGSREFRREDVLAHVVAELLSSLGVREDAYAVVAMPHDFGESERTATKRAVESVGVDVVDVIDRAVAAGLNFGADLGAHDWLFVYDFGDEFHATLLDARGGSLRRVAGADDARSTRARFDDALADHLLAEYLDAGDEADVPNEGEATDAAEVPDGGRARDANGDRAAAAKYAAHRVRSELRPGDVVEVELGELLGRDESLTVGPDAVADGTADVVERTLTTTDELFDDPEVDVHPWQVDGLVLTGDVAQVPPVADAVEDLFDSEAADANWTPLTTAGGAALGAVANAPTGLAPRDVLAETDERPSGGRNSDDDGTDGDGVLPDWLPWGDADPDPESAGSEGQAGSERGSGSEARSGSRSASATGSASADDSETANRWWEYSVLSLLAPVGLFVAYVLAFAVRNPPDDVGLSAYPFVTALAFAFLASIVIAPFLFAVAASRDKRHLDSVTGRSNPRHPITLLIAVVVTYGTYALFYVAWRRRKYDDGLFSGRLGNGLR